MYRCVVVVVVHPIDVCVVLCVSMSRTLRGAVLQAEAMLVAMMRVCGVLC